MSTDLVDMCCAAGLPVYFADEPTTHMLEIRLVARTLHNSAAADAIFNLAARRIEERGRSGRWFSWFSERGTLISVSKDAGMVVASLSQRARGDICVVEWFLNELVAEVINVARASSLPPDEAKAIPLSSTTRASEWRGLDDAHADTRMRALHAAAARLPSHTHDGLNQSRTQPTRKDPTLFIAIAGHLRKDTHDKFHE